MKRLNSMSAATKQAKLNFESVEGWVSHVET